MQNRYYLGLDGLRGVAVAVVLLAHASVPFLESGGVGVDIFFTLSGFLITSILLTEWVRHGSIAIKNFYARRFLRLLPCLWLTVAAYLVCFCAMSGTIPRHALKDAGAALLYVMNWVRAYDYGGTGALGHTWSLAIEEQYYLLWPFLIVMLNRLGLSRRRQGWLLASAALLLALHRAALVGNVSAGRLYFGLDTHADGLLLGSALACFLSGSGGQPLSAGWSKLISYVFAPGAVAGLAVVAGCWTWNDPGMGLYGYAAAAICSGLLVLDLVASPHSLLRRPLSAGPLVWAGKVSYGLYLWHFPIYAIINRNISGVTWQHTLLVGGTLSVLVAAASYYLVERRFLRLKDRFSSAKATGITTSGRKICDFGIAAETNSARLADSPKAHGSRLMDALERFRDRQLSVKRIEDPDEVVILE